MNFQRLTPTETQHRLLPFTFARIPDTAGDVLVTNLVGEHAFIEAGTLSELAEDRPISSERDYFALRSMHVLSSSAVGLDERMLAIKYRTKKAYLREGPGLHIVVVTLRCDHSCQYCQVSRAPLGASGYDMSAATAAKVVDSIFHFPGNFMTIEFQGGEPLLNFDRIRQIVTLSREKAIELGKEVRFTIATTLHHATDEVLAFFQEHEFHVSTSLDGPPHLHDAARRLPGGDASAKTLAALDRTRRYLGQDRISALTTLTRANLGEIEGTIDYLVALGFRSLFLRGLSPFGFANKTKARIGYDTVDFCDAYKRAINHLLDLNRAGVSVSEAYASILLANILTPFSHNYVDLRSPLGAGLGAIVYNYDGYIYPSDEARMLAEQGDPILRIGQAGDKPAELLNSEAMQVLLASGVSEALPGCSDCAFATYCGADPIHHYATQDDFVGHRALSDFCKKQTTLFEFLFQLLHRADRDTQRFLTNWATNRV